jgi:biotin operon repressor
MNTKMIENAKEVRDLVFLTLQEHDDWVTSSVIANELGLGREQVKTALTKLKTQHPEIISNRSFGYKITSSKKNNEGYSDPTASTAINNVSDNKPDTKSWLSDDREYNTSYYGACYDNILPGTLWETSSSKGDPEYFFVVVDWVNGAPMAFGIPMYQDGYGQIDLTVSSILHGDFYGSMSQIRCKPMKYFKSEVTIKCSSDALAQAKKLIGNLIGMDSLIRDEHKAGYNEGYFKGIEDGKECEDYKKALEEQHKEALAEEHQRGLREGTDKGYDKGYKDGYDAGKKEADVEWNAKEVARCNCCEYRNVEKPEPETHPNETVDYADVVQLITERNLYKNFYEQLLEVMKS